MQKASTSFTENMRRRGIDVQAAVAKAGGPAIGELLTKGQRLDAIRDRLAKLEKSVPTSPAAVAQQAGSIMEKAAELSREEGGTVAGAQARRVASQALATQLVAKGMMGRTT